MKLSATTKTNITWAIAVIAAIFTIDARYAKTEEQAVHVQEYVDFTEQVAALTSQIQMQSESIDKLAHIHTDEEREEAIQILVNITEAIERLNITRAQRDLSPLEIDQLAGLLAQQIGAEARLANLGAE